MFKIKHRATGQVTSIPLESNGRTNASRVPIYPVGAGALCNLHCQLWNLAAIDRAQRDLHDRAVALVEHTPIRAPNGKTVHATSLYSPRRTACKRWQCDGWIVVAEGVTCQRCKEELANPSR